MPAQRVDDVTEERFRRSAARLRYIARLQRMPPDTIDDIVQETLLEAWKSLENLRDETRFDAWLDAICRNVCLRSQRKQGILRSRETTLQPPYAEEQATDTTDPFACLADPDTFDPTEELARQDMVTLLDRALGYLPHESRIAVEGYYLAEIPQKELAERLGLSLSALEARLHRARGHMLHTLSHDLRDEALALGLAILPADALGWRKTQITCFLCGRTLMQGRFEPMAEGRIDMQLRCPACQTIAVSTYGLVDLTQARSFLPATKKVVRDVGQFFLAALADGGIMQCWVCQQLTRLCIRHDPQCAPIDGPQTSLYSSCGCIQTGIFALSPYGALPEVRDFIFGTSAIIILPDMRTTYAGRDATRFGLLSLADGRRLYVFADHQTLLPLAVTVEREITSLNAVSLR